MESILKVVPSEYRVALGSKDTSKEAQVALKTMRLGSERACKAKAHQLCREYEALDFHDGLSVEDFSLCLTNMVTQLVALGKPAGEDDTVHKSLRCIHENYEQTAVSFETCVEMEVLTIEDIMGHLNVAEDRFTMRAK
jgi:hypothetical protein